MISSWMVTFPYRATFFFQAGAVAAFHRLMLRYNRGEDVADQPNDPLLESGNRLMPVTVISSNLSPNITLENKPATEVNKSFGINWAWNRIGLIDLILIAVLTRIVIQFWKYILTHGIPF